MQKPAPKDIIFLSLLTLFGLIYLWVQHAFQALPYEDAAILMRYVGHLGTAEGIVWNKGGSPVDGATDFLFLVLASVIHALGIRVESAVLGLNVMAYLGSLHLLYWGWRRKGNGQLISFCAALLLAFGPAYAYIQAYFASPFFAFLVILNAFFALELLQKPEIKTFQIAYGLTALLMGLCRPEGVLLSIFMSLSLVGYVGKRKAWPILKIWAMWLFGMGSIYLIWHFFYFGYLLPNPFYKKGGGAFYPLSLYESIKNSLLLLFPLLLIYLYAFWKTLDKNYIYYTFFPIMGFGLIWGLLSNEMNYLMRFQYVVFPLALLNLGYMWKGNSFVGKRMWMGGMIWFLMVTYYIYNFQGKAINQDGRYEVAKILYEFREKGYSIALSEAGLLPFYSEWKSLDTWGLNDHQIAKEKLISFEYLEEFAPDMLMFDAYDEEYSLGQNRIWTHYQAMIELMQHYVKQYKFELIAKYTAPDQRHAHYYYINPQIEDVELIKAKIRACSYYWYEEATIIEAEQ